jgi:hypothetical protein
MLKSISICETVRDLLSPDLDGTPFPVDRATYDRTIHVLLRAVNRAYVDRGEKVRAFRRLAGFAS